MAIYYLLSDSGEEFNTNIKNEKCLKLDLTDCKKFVAIASTPDDYETNDMYFIESVGQFSKLGKDFEKTDLIDSRLTKDKATELISEADFIYLMGGNPVTQIEFLNSNGYSGLIRQFDGVVMGVSAGAMNMGLHSYYSKDQDFDTTFMYRGIGLVDITVDPHFDDLDEEQVEDGLKNSKIHSIIGLPAESSIRVEDNDIMYIGDYFELKEGAIVKYKPGTQKKM